MESDIRLLELAEGIKDALINSGLLSIKSILNKTSADISQGRSGFVYSANYSSGG